MTASVDQSNVDQLAAWDGDQGAFWVARAQRFDEGVARYQETFLDAAAIKPADRVLDVGCGNGRTTRDAARRATDGSALGVDLSTGMLAVARRLAAEEGVANAEFRQADAQVHPFPAASFDVVVSRHGSMFFGDPPAAFANLRRALCPGGRLVLLTWQPVEANEWLRTFRRVLSPDGTGDPVPPKAASLSEEHHIRALLTGAGFTDVRLTGLTRPMYYGQTVQDAAEFVLGLFGGLLRPAEQATRTAAEAALRADLAAHQTPEGVLYGSAAWLVEATRP
ncbi:SAM-dependent methyltransferase [Crossiella equi]|uniref:SAM-dependent methyltransferase n=1 Tax=Crossiella equi TaxID=130796 RepID=A0ABS5ANV6_9PSEU|nr:class I SAM-dependent methyltransferase [Crossiella equi]MBP2478246.1 SAM-dependent methyltransferase [Crossiella equi]